MLIGLTYDLRKDYLAEGYSLEETAECDKIETVEGIEAALHELGYATDRIGNGKQLIGRLAAGERWDLVFNFAEGLHGVAREGQVPAILDMYRIPYTFSDPLVLGLSLHKDMTKTIVRLAGVPTPEFALIRRVEELETIDLPFPLFAKPVAEGTSKGVTADSKILDLAGLKKACAALLEQFRQPVLVETYLSGREFTVGILGRARKRKWSAPSRSRSSPKPRTIFIRIIRNKNTILSCVTNWSCPGRTKKSAAAKNSP